MAIRKTKQEKARFAAEAKSAELRRQAAELNAHARLLSKEAGAGIAETMAELAEKAAEVADRIRTSDAYGKALERSGEAASAARHRGAEVATVARGKLAESGLDERARDLLEALKESEGYLKARDRTSAATRTSLAALGTWLTSGNVGKQLGVERRRRRWPAWLLGLLGVGAGYAVGVLTAPKRGEELRDQWASVSTSAVETARKVGSRVQQDTADVSTPPAEGPLEDKIRTVLGQDPRTSSLPKLNVNVVEGTVFVRGAVSSDVDTEVIRGVIADIEGVEDVDLQLTTT